MNQPDYDLKQLTKSTISKMSDEVRLKGLFDRAIKLGQINNPDTPSNWIAWAKGKGYSTDHLNSFINKQESNNPKINNKSGQIPRIAIGQIVVEVACEIEHRTGRLATAIEVLKKLQIWADNGQKYSDVLHPPPNGFRGMGVYWITSKSRKKMFSLGACEKTLEKWNKSRQ